MVMKKCIICGKPFDARGGAKCCSSECSKENGRRLREQWRADNPEYMREYSKQWRADNPEYDAQYYQNNREHKREYDAQRYQDNREHALERQRKRYADNPEYAAQYYLDNRDEIIKKSHNRNQKIISELCEQYDGDLEQILENIPSQWQVREAKTQVWFGESYCDGIMAKIKSTPVCEVTGVKDDLRIHHLYSFNTHPELGNDPANMVRITNEVHKAFHKEYGYGNNTPEQWVEFLEQR